MVRQSESAQHLRAHDYNLLVRRWRTLTRQNGWQMRSFAEADGFPVYVVRSPGGGGRTLYLSAGIHGDEPAATEALITWCERRATWLHRAELMIFPCLNPWGLQHNSRNDRSGRDLNRGYHRKDVPVIEAQKGLLQGRVFEAAVMLHEDFDARGVYLYEVAGVRPFWGEEIVAAGSSWIPREPRTRLDGWRCRQGLVRPRITPESLPEHPEALFVYFGHTRRSITLETPSEFSMRERVRAHGAMLDALWRLSGRRKN